MKTIEITSTNKRGQRTTFKISAEKTSGNFYRLTVESPDVEIWKIDNGLAVITAAGVLRKYTLDNWKLKGSAVSQMIITPSGGSNKDRYTVQFSNDELRETN
jgi:hypothetical protein